MKRIFTLIIFYLLFVNYAKGQVCCPDFYLQATIPVSSCDSGGNNSGSVGPKRDVPACKESASEYYIYPALPGYNYNWVVTGGTPSTFTGNPIVINWDTVSTGKIICYISDPTGACKDTIEQEYTLIKRPIASFTYTPNTSVCPTVPINFTFNGVNGNNYQWDFGDGNYASGTTTTHSYSAPGTYTVLLTVKTQSFQEECGCRDTASAIITVNSGTVPTINTTCKKMLCAGDTASYCVTPLCPPYTWTVSGGTIVGSSTGSCIQVLWNTPPAIYPPKITVSTGICGGQCSNIGSLNVPVLYNGMTITGKSIICPSTSNVYSIQSTPGTFYKWTLSGGGLFTSPDSNATSVSILFNASTGTTRTLTCTYNNPITGCSGTSVKLITPRPVFKIGNAFPICVGGTGFASTLDGSNANFSLDPTTGWAPTSPLTNVAFGSFTFNTAGYYEVTGVPTVPSNYCTPSDNFGLTVKDTPTVAPITGPTTSCIGTNAIYAATSNIPDGLFTWTVSAGGTILAQLGAYSDSIAVNWIGAGPHTITVFQQNGICFSSPISITVNDVAPPVISNGATNACVDQTFIYTATNNFAPGQYTWNINPVNGGTIVNGQGNNSIGIQWHGSTLTPTTTNTVYVTTCSGVDSIIVIVGTPPPVTILPTGNLCSGGITLTSSITGVAYQWYLNNSPINNATNQSYLANTFGSYKVEVFQVIGGCASKATYVIPPITFPYLVIPCGAGVIENLPPDTTVLKYCSNTAISATLNIGNSAGYTFTWYRNSFSNVVGSGISYTATQLGSYWVVANNGLGCIDTLGIIKIDTVCCDSTYTITHTDAGCDTKFFDANISPTPTPIFPYRWCFGDGATALTIPDTVSHKYIAAGQYNVCVYTRVLNGPDTCAAYNCRNIDVNLVANFDTNIVCGAVNLIDLSTAYPASYLGYTYNWTCTGTVTFVPNNAVANPTILVSNGGTYNITLSISKNGCTSTVTKSLYIPLVIASIQAPDTICAGTDAPFIALPSGNNFSYSWNFGDNATSFLGNTNHSYPTPPPSIYTPQVIVEDEFGCKDTATKNILVINAPSIFITPNQLICPDNSAIIAVGPAIFQTYQWYVNNALIPLATLPFYSTNVIGNYHVLATANNGGCVVKSPVSSLLHYPPAIAKIEGPTGPQCLVSGTANVQLYSKNYCPTCSYTWVAEGTITPILSITDTLNLSYTLPGTYSYVMQVVTTDGCTSYDTLCVIIGESPNAIGLIAPSGFPCAGSSNTFTAVATPYNANYVYNWSNGSKDTFLVTGEQGFHNVTITNPSNGCSNTLGFFVFARPNTILFPVGCDTLCDTDKVFIPLPVNGGFLGVYTINWYLNGNYATPIATGGVLNLNSLPIGNNNITCTVAFGTGCTDTTEVFNLYVKDCTPPPLSLNNISLQAILKDKQVALQWQAATAYDYYTIEKSIDAINFENKYLVNAIPGQLTYTYQDDVIDLSKNIFYRIKGNNNTYLGTSNVAAIGFTNKAFVNIYPNPATNGTIIINSGVAIPSQISMYNAQGSLVLFTDKCNALHTLYTNNLANGVYGIKVNYTDGTTHLQYIKVVNE
jgi:large repetitive protein